MLYAENIEPNYENFIADCPHCQYKNIFNRVFDLETTEIITHKIVRCFNCEKEFGINRDIIQPRYRAIFFDCYPLYKDKRYSSCILLLTQSLEVLFYHYLRVELIYRPFWKQSEHNVDRVKELCTSLENKVKTFAYEKLKNVFLNLVIKINQTPILSLDDSESIIKIFSKNEPSDEELKQSISNNSNLVDLLLKLKKCDLVSLRNKVVHKNAYRPKRDEVDVKMKEVREIIIKIGTKDYLNCLGEDLNDYK